MLTEERFERVVEAAKATGMKFKERTKIREGAYGHTFWLRTNEDDPGDFVVYLTGMKNGRKGFALSHSYLYSSEFDQKEKYRLSFCAMSGIETVDEAAGRYVIHYKDGSRTDFQISQHKEGVLAILNKVLEDDAAVEDPEAVCQEGYRLYNKGKYKEAFQLFIQASQVGNARAQFWMGYCCAVGRGFFSSRDYYEANRWYLKAAQQGNADGARNLAINYKNGNGTGANDDGTAIRDEKAADFWYKKAMESYEKKAEKGNNYAMYWLGIFYEEGRGTKPDMQKAVAWYGKAADRGNADALCRMAELLCSGTGVAKDTQRAKTYAEKARKAGSKTAGHVLRMIYEATHEPLDLNSRYETIAIPDRVTVEFGSYPTQKEGTKAPIEWLTLARRGERVLLISKYYLYSRPYDRNKNVVNWKDSGLRKWLNEEFFAEAFTDEEREQIQRTEIENGYSRAYPMVSEGKFENVSESTVDSIFCLSVDEAVRFFTAPGAQARCYTKDYDLYRKDWVDLGGKYTKSVPTPYALAVNGTQCKYWWLRTPGGKFGYSGNVCACDSSSLIGLCGDSVDLEFVYVRPAMWV